jgi:hypothetical protein
MRIKRSQKNATKFVGIKASAQGGLGDLFIERHVLQLVFHDLSRYANALAALLSDRNELAQLLDRFRLIAANRFAKGFVTDGVTQTNVHLLLTSIVL